MSLRVWARPLVRPLAHNLGGRARTKGAAQSKVFSKRRGTASPHIGRRSRMDGVEFQNRRLIFKTESHIRWQGRSGWSQVSGTALEFQVGISHPVAKPWRRV